MAEEQGEDRQLIIDQLIALASGIGKTFAPFCEVVVHDLSRSDHAVVHIENNLTGRAVGDPATELGLARLADPHYKQVIANYQNQLKDGRQLKSTSVGIRDGSGRYVAALCLNIDLTQFHSVLGILEQFSRIETENGPLETLETTNNDRIKKHINAFAARHASAPRSLKTEERQTLVRELKLAGLLDIRHASSTIAKYLNVSRATIYNDMKLSNI
ncbi:PAS domain-containing protein [Alcaligenaceae bacterium]|nr:PAS domain-containing protein [Alcaligenaceae bacterium]